MERMVVEHFHHSTQDVPLQGAGLASVVSSPAVVDSSVLSLHQMVGNSAITPAIRRRAKEE